MKKLALAAVVVCLGLYGWGIRYDRGLKQEDPFGYRNLKACPKIAPGATEADLVGTLGAPERGEEGNGIRRLTFHTHRAAASPIRAEVDPTSGRVLALRCAGDDQPMWTVPR